MSVDEGMLGLMLANALLIEGWKLAGERRKEDIDGNSSGELTVSLHRCRHSLSAPVTSLPRTDFIALARYRCSERVRGLVRKRVSRAMRVDSCGRASHMASA